MRAARLFLGTTLAFAALACAAQPLELLDRPARRLQISVRFDGGAEAWRRGVEAGGTIGNRGSSVEIRAQESQASSAERVDQRVQVVEGGRAFIALSQSRPVRQRQRVQTPAGVVSQETFVVQEASTGFEVSPRLAGERVFVDIVQQRQAFAGPGVRETGVSTSASGRLGEWFELGAVASGARVWVKVEEMRN